MEQERLPASLWIEAHLRHLDTQGVSYYIVNKGAYAAGTVLLKLNGLGAGCRVLIQQRDLEGNLGWMDAMAEENPDEAKADDYIRRSLSRDPDLWVIEIEDKEMKNPFEGKVL
jgi:hypothetical protein